MSTESMQVEPTTAPAQPVVTAPAVVPETPAAAARPNGRTRNTNDIVIPQQAFKSRVQREAAAIVQKRLGVSLEEAAEIVQKGRATAPAAAATSAQATATDAIAQHQAEIAKLRKQVEKANRVALEWQAKHRKDTTKLRDRQLETELKLAAQQTGVMDTDYALHLLARQVATGKDTDPEQFFAGLKTSHPYLFGQTQPAAAPAQVPVTTAPPESQAPGEVTPQATPAGATRSTPNVEEMNPQEFNRHLRSYGYTPGA